MKLRNLIIFALFLILMGCSGEEFKPDTFSQDDMCIVKTENKAKVCYGMSRSEAERLLGTGEKGVGDSIKYDFGIRVFYRNDAVAGVILDQDSKGVFKTARGVEIGMPKDDIKKLHGATYSLEDEKYMNYIYDIKRNEFLDTTLLEKKQSPEDMESTYILSAGSDSEGFTDIISVFDRKMGFYFN